MEIKYVTLSSDPKLMKQYMTMRHELKGFPNEPLRGDEKAVFLLAIAGGKVRMGMRLNKPDLHPEPGTPLGWMPVDKVPGAKLETLLPNHPEIVAKLRSGDPQYKVMYADGIYSNIDRDTEKLPAMIATKMIMNEMADYAKEAGFSMVYCFPKDHDAHAIEKIIGREGIKAINYGPQPYTNHMGETRGLHKNLLVFALDPQIIGALRKPEPGIGAESRVRA